MRHQIAGRRLGRSTGQRTALFRNLVTELFRHGKIRTTEAKAKAIRPDAERLITIAKRGLNEESYALHARRLAAARLNGPDVVKVLFDEIAPRFEARPGGYTRILKLGPRKGDGAEIVLLELVD
jgi:large subunit ribosomal protein L17